MTGASSFLVRPFFFSRFRYCHKLPSSLIPVFSDISELVKWLVSQTIVKVNIFFKDGINETAFELCISKKFDKGGYVYAVQINISCPQVNKAGSCED